MARLRVSGLPRLSPYYTTHTHTQGGGGKRPLRSIPLATDLFPRTRRSGNTKTEGGAFRSHRAELHPMAPHAPMAFGSAFHSVGLGYPIPILPPPTPQPWHGLPHPSALRTIYRTLPIPYTLRLALCPPTIRASHIRTGAVNR